MRAVPTRDSVLPSSQGKPTSRYRPHATLKRSVIALAAVPLFDGFSKAHLRRLAREADLVEFGPGRAIVEEARAGEAMFVILTGKARVVRAGRKVGALIPGDFFGELSALDGGPRTASVVPDTPMEVLRLYRHTLVRLMKQEPALAMNMLEGIARRLRQVQAGTPVA
jgi:CRP/FNR family cyclic AMP-dependent transcriptional regulator